MKQRIVLVTGASSGIGTELARLLAANGDFPVMAARKIEVLEELRREIGTGLVFRCDVTDGEQVSRLIEETASRLGRIDVLVNNAGFGKFGGLLDVRVDEYRAMMEVNYLGAVRMTRKVIPVMLKQGGGRIINISSVAGLTGIPNLAGYVASKYALIGFSESVHMEFAPRIRVGVLCPGPVDTPFFGEKNPRDLFPGLVYRHMLDARTVAKEAMKLMDRPRFRVIPAGIRWAFRFRGWFPALSRKVTGMLYRPLLNKGGIRSQV